MRNNTCPNCGKELDTTTINRRADVMSCAYCGGVVDLGRERATVDALDSTPIFVDGPPPARPIYIKPSSVQIKQDGSRQIISWRWLNKHSMLKFVHAIFYLFGPLLLFLLLLIFGGFADWIAYLLAPITFIYQVVARASQLYETIACLVNKTTIELDEETLRVRHSPLHWHHEVTVKRGAIRQFHASKRLVTGFFEKKKTIRNELNASLRSGRSITVLSGPESSHHILFLEQELERYLDLDDIPAPHSRHVLAS